jgi:hypothetical protein
MRHRLTVGQATGAGVGTEDHRVAGAKVDLLRSGGEL